jgi:hypothetical protein
MTNVIVYSFKGYPERSSGHLSAQLESVEPLKSLPQSGPSRLAVG